MRNRLRELIDKSFQGEITGLDPDGHPVSFEHHERCRTMTELATKFHSPKNAKGHLSVAQVSRMINNPHRKLRPDQAEVFFWQVEPTSGLDKEEFLDVLAADFRQRNESAEAEEARFRMTALERELAEVKDQLRSVTAKFEQSQELLRRENEKFLASIKPVSDLMSEFTENARQSIEEMRRLKWSWSELIEEAEASEDEGESNAA